MKRLSKIGLFVTLAFLIIVGRVLYESHTEYIKGVTQERTGKVEEAIAHYDRAVHWYTPGNLYNRKAIEALWSIGQRSEEENRKLALLAYDAMRGSIHAIRSFYWPYRQWLSKVNGRIAELRAREQVKENPAIKFQTALAFHEQALMLNERPEMKWVLLVEVGFLGWMGSVLGLIWRGFDREGRMFLKPSMPWMMGIVLFFSLWVIGLVKA